MRGKYVTATCKRARYGESGSVSLEDFTHPDPRYPTIRAGVKNELAILGLGEKELDVIERLVEQGKDIDREVPEGKLTIRIRTQEIVSM